MYKYLTTAAVFAAIIVFSSANTGPAVAATKTKAPSKDTLSHKFANDDMHLLCNSMNLDGAALDQVFIEDDFVLATFRCGTISGWSIFKLAGAVRAPRSTIASHLSALNIEALMHIGMDRQTAEKLMKQLEATQPVVP